MTRSQELVRLVRLTNSASVERTTSQQAESDEKTRTDIIPSCHDACSICTPFPFHPSIPNDKTQTESERERERGEGEGWSELTSKSGARANCRFLFDRTEITRRCDRREVEVRRRIRGKINNTSKIYQRNREIPYSNTITNCTHTEA